MFVETVAKPSINEVTQELNLLTEKYSQDVSNRIDQTKSLKEKLKNSKEELKAEDPKPNTDNFHAKIEKLKKADEHLDQEVVIAPSLNPLLSAESEQFVHFYVVKKFLEDEKSNDDESYA